MKSAPVAKRLKPAEKDRLIRLCKKFLSIDSTNPTGTVQLGQFAGDQLKKLGFQVKFQQVRFAGAVQYNLLARLGPARGRPLIWNTHLDTVTTDASQWTQTQGNPFRPALKRGRLYGLGAADTKLAMACQLIALAGVAREGLQRPLLVTGTYGEEMGLIGVQRLIKSPWVRAGDVLNSEPTQLQMTVGNKGFRVYRFQGREKKSVRKFGKIFEIEFLGRAAHSATSHLGDNAIERALEWLKKNKLPLDLISIQGGLAPNIVAPRCRIQVLIPWEPHFTLRVPGGNVLEIKESRSQRVFPGILSQLFRFQKFFRSRHGGGETQNLGVIEVNNGKLKLILDHRFPFGRDPDVVWSKLLKWVRKVDRGGSGDYQVSILRDNPAFTQPLGSPWVRRVRGVLREMKINSDAVHKPGCTEAGYFAERGCDVITIGPGPAYGNIHQPNEYVPVKELESAALFYRRIFRGTCL